MKPTISDLFVFTLLGFIAFHLNSCKPDGDYSCAETETETLDLSVNDLSKVPYIGFDTLSFLTKTGDTSIVVGDGKLFYYDTREIFGDPACPANTIRNEQAYKIKYTTIKGSLGFSFVQQRKNSYIIISKSNYSCDFYIESNSVGIEASFDYPYYIDSITINGVTYDKVRRAIAIKKSNGITQDTTYKLLYNKTKGILLVKSETENEEYSILD